jgi:serine/threonine protein phosphatase 1
MKTKRLIAIGDIHGNLELLLNLVEKQIKFNPDTDVLVFLGDYIDRGGYSLEVVSYLKNLKSLYPENIVLLMGNHEDLVQTYLNEPTPSNLYNWVSNGGDATIRNFGGLGMVRRALAPFIVSLNLYYETDTHIFVHGGVPSGKTPSTSDADDLLWDRDFENTTGKTIVVGHTPHSSVTRYPNGVIVTDTGAFHTGRLSAYDVKDGGVYEAVRIRTAAA